MPFFTVVYRQTSGNVGEWTGAAETAGVAIWRSACLRDNVLAVIREDDQQAAAWVAKRARAAKQGQADLPVEA